jgi:hypothetical protein
MKKSGNPRSKADRRHGPSTKREPTNLSLNGVIKSRALLAAQELGYDLSNLVENFLERLHEAHHRTKGKRAPGEPIEITITDRTPE